MFTDPVNPLLEVRSKKFHSSSLLGIPPEIEEKVKRDSTTGKGSEENKEKERKIKEKKEQGKEREKNFSKL